MESVFDMLRPLHFVFLFAAFAILAFAAAAENEAPPNVQSEVETQPSNANDLEADATYWGYRRPYWGWGGYGGGYGRGYGGGWGGWGGYGGWRGGYWGGRGYGWGGRGYGGGWGGWGGGYWG